MPTRPTATSTSRSAATRNTASSRTATSTTSTRARAWRAPSASATRSTSRCGRRTSPARTPPGTSPWGPGRPGWHIECSAMAEQLLGVDFEIHGGGSDLIFPHHENEAAQTCAARGAPLARLWVHNGMVRLDQEKMSKSVGNIFLLARGARRLRPRRADHVLLRRPLPPADRVRRRAPGRGRGPGSSGSARPPGGSRPGRRRRGRRRCASGSSTRWPTTSTRRRRSRRCSNGCARPTARPTGHR